MSLNTERLIQQVAAKWGLVISKDDPIIGAVALNDVVLDLHMDRLTTALEEHSRALDALNAQQVQASKAIAKKVVGDALTVAKLEIDEAAQAAIRRTDQAAAVQLVALDQALERLAVWRRRLLLAWTVAGVFAVLALILMVR